MCDCAHETRVRNTQIFTSSINQFLVSYNEQLPGLSRFRVCYVVINMDNASPLIAYLAASVHLTLNSKTLSSRTNGSFSFTNGDGRAIIASFPIWPGDFSTTAGRTVLKSMISYLGWTAVNDARSVNLLDFSLHREDGDPIVLGPNDKIGICIETESKI